MSEDDCLDGNAAAGPLSTVFAVDLTAAECQCAHCGAIDRFARTRLYMTGPGVVARCAICESVLLRLVSAGQRLLLEARGLAYLSLESSQIQESGQ